MSGYGFVASSSGYDDEDRGIGFQPVVKNRTHNPPHELLTVASQSVTHDANVARHSVTEFATEIYFQDGQQTIADSPSETAAGSPTHTYVDASHIDEPLMRGGSGGLRYYHRNQHFSITAVSDGGGSVVERYAYSAYGQVTIADGSGSQISNSAISNRYTYTGREWDEGLSLYHYRARMYDAVAGRFVSRDPIGFAGSKWNLFTSFNNSPKRFLDAFGTFTHTPPTYEEMIECCKKYGDNPKNIFTPIFGWIQCCKCTPIACSRIAEPSKYTPAAKRITHKCVLLHEKDHSDDIEDCFIADCPCKRARFSIRLQDDKSGQAKQECSAYKIKVDCLKTALSNNECDSEDCLSQIRKHREDLISYAKRTYGCKNF